MGATIRDVAEAAGVSVATVSRALHAGAHVAPGTRARVERAAARLSYTPSAAAARLRTGRHGSVAVLVGGRLTQGTVDVLAGASEELATHAVDCTVRIVGDHGGAGDLRALPGRVDAALVVGDVAIRQVDELAGAGLPLVVVGPAVGGQIGVDVDRSYGVRLVEGHLRAAGYEHPAVLADGSASSRAWSDRLTVGPHRAPVGPERSSTVDGAARAAASLLASTPDLDAIIATTDALARGAHAALVRHGRRPGEDIGLVGLGSEVLSDELDLTMVVPPDAQLGAEAARLALHLSGASAVEVTAAPLVPQLVVRGSTLRRSVALVPSAARGAQAIVEASMTKR
jgi:LacI family transcriptional regulator